MRRFAALLAWVALGLSLLVLPALPSAGAGVAAPDDPPRTRTPVPRPTGTPTATPSRSPTATSTATRSPTATRTATPAPSATGTGTPTATPSPAATATPTTTAGGPTASPTATATAAPSPSPTATDTPTAAPSPSPTATACAAAAVPAAPLILSPREGAIVPAGALPLDWADVAGCVDYYNVQVLDSAGAQVDIAWPNGSEYTVPPGALAQGSGYTAYVWAHDAAGFGKPAAVSFAVAASRLSLPTIRRS